MKPDDPDSYLADDEVLADDPPERTTSLRPLAMAVFLGIAIGFAAGFPLGLRIQPSDDETRANATAPTTLAPPIAAAVEPTPEKVPAAPLLSVAPAAPAAPPATKAPAPEPSLAVAPAVKPVDVPSGSISIRSTPSGARVLVDGRDVGRTPFTTKDVAHGTHDVRIIRDGYVPVDKRVQVTAAKPSQAVTVALKRSPPAPQARAARTEPAPATRQPGSLGVESRPIGANVFIDGKLVGTTPLLLASVTPGEHAVRLELDGHREWVASVSVAAGERRRVAASLER